MTKALLSPGGCNEDSRTPTCGFLESDRRELTLERIALLLDAFDRGPVPYDGLAVANDDPEAGCSPACDPATGGSSTPE